MAVKKKFKNNNLLNLKLSNSGPGFLFKKSILLKPKLSQSMIISVVLLILLVIIAIGIIAAFVIPFVKEQLSSGDCLDYVNKFEIVNNPAYTCYETGEMNLQIRVIDIGEYRGFAVELGKGSSSESVKIYPETSDNVEMYGDSEADITIPENNGAETYSITSNTKPDYIKVYPILENGKLCSTPDSLDVIADCPTA